MLIVRACFGAQTCIHMKANTLNDIYFFGRMLYNEFLQNVHLGPKSNIIIVSKTIGDGLVKIFGWNVGRYP